MRRSPRNAVISSLCFLSIIMLVVSALLVNPQSARATTCTTTVSPGPGTPIQSAIDAATSGAVICISGGNYSEQLSITTPLTLEGLGTGANQTVIAPTSVTANSVSPDSGNAEAAIILVSDTTQVTITKLTINGSLASSSINNGCSPPSYEGVLFSGASGSLTNSEIANLYQASPSLYGCQSNAADAVLVQTPSGGASSVSVTGNTVTNYQKNGIACKDPGSNCTIEGNTVSPLAAVTGATGDAANGVEVAYGAVSTVSDNTISGNECNVSVCGPNLVNQTQSAGILTYQSGAGTVVQGNTVSGNDIGIATVGDAVTSMDNGLQNNRYEGLLLNDGTYIASGNAVSGSMIGIAVVSDGFVSNPTLATLTGNSLTGSSTSPVQVVAFYGGAYGGANVENASVSFGGAFEAVAPGPSGGQSTVNVTPPTTSTQTTTTSTTTAAGPGAPPQCASGLYSGYYTNPTTNSTVNFENLSYATARALVMQDAPGAMGCQSASTTTTTANNPSSTASQLSVETMGSSGNAMSGYYTVLDQNGNTVATGFSPTVFDVSSGQTYSVEVQNYGSCVFDHWSDTGSTDRLRTVTATSSAQVLMAVYDCGSPTTTGGPSTISVSGMNSAGGAITGYYTTLWQDGALVQSCFSPCSFTVNAGQAYQVAVADFGGEVFSHWSDGTLTRFYTVNVPGSATAIDLTAIYSP
jgi:parallel beta-helix repeat protein